MVGAAGLEPAALCLEGGPDTYDVLLPSVTSNSILSITLKGSQTKKYQVGRHFTWSPHTLTKTLDYVTKTLDYVARPAFCPAPHPGCPQLHAIDGRSAEPSQYAPQYLLSVAARQLQPGWAHFSDFCSAIRFPLTSVQYREKSKAIVQGSKQSNSDPSRCYNSLHMAKSQADRSLLEAALIGFGEKLGGINLRIAEIRRVLGYGGPSTESPAPAKRKRKPMSAAARARIAAAQKKRWAAVKRDTAASTKKSSASKPKRKMSAAGRKRIAEAARKRWAAIKAQTKTSAATG